MSWPGSKLETTLLLARTLTGTRGLFDNDIGRMKSPDSVLRPGPGRSIQTQAPRITLLLPGKNASWASLWLKTILPKSPHASTTLWQDDGRTWEIRCLKARIVCCL